jgi:hypothetical protein
MGRAGKSCAAVGDNQSLPAAGLGPAETSAWMISPAAPRRSTSRTSTSVDDNSYRAFGGKLPGVGCFRIAWQC